MATDTTSRAASGAFASGSGVLQNSQAVIDAVEAAAKLLELRPSTHYPILDYVDYSAGHLLAAGGDITLVGRGLLGGTASPETFDAITIDETGTAGGKYTVTCLKPGVSGFTFEQVVGSGALAIAFEPAVGKLTVTLASGGSTADAIATAINANSALTDGYLRANVVTAGTMSLAKAVSNLAGGTGSSCAIYNKVIVGGLEALPANEAGTAPTAKWSATSIVVTVPALTGMGTSDAVAIQVTVNGRTSNAISKAVDAS